MPINLSKGQRIDLTKGKASLSHIHVGLGWDEAAPQRGGGLLSSLFGSLTTANIDCDASVIMLKDDTFEELVYFGKLKSKCKSIRHMGDNLTGEGEGDDEVIMVDLKSVPSHFNKLVFVVNIFNAQGRKQDFGMIKNAFIRVVDPKTHEELIHFDLTDNYQGFTSLIVGELYRHNGEWKFAAIGEGTNDTDLKQISARYR